MNNKNESKKLIRLDGVKLRTGLSKTKLYKLIRENEFPKPIHPAGSRMSAWLDCEITGWIDVQVLNSRQGGAQ